MSFKKSSFAKRMTGMNRQGPIRTARRATRIAFVRKPMAMLENPCALFYKLARLRPLDGGPLRRLRYLK
jgi:hypothetical protein